MPERVRPSFEQPPVVEVVCGIYFQTLAAMQAPHFGLFWDLIRKDFPRCHTAEPIIMPVEVSGQLVAHLNIGTLPPLPRLWFINDLDTSLVQLQTDCFLYNWKRGKDADAGTYPRYPDVVTRFRGLFHRFVRFAEKNALGDIAPLQLEMTYINLVSRDEIVRDNADIGELFPDLDWKRASRYLPAPSAVHWRSRFDMDGGRLEISVQSGRRADDPEHRQTARFDCVARGPCPDLSGGDEKLWKWFDRANEWIVDGFIDITSERFQRDVWKRAT